MIVCFLKGKLIWGVLGLYIPPIAIVTACRLARPNSWWARNKYDDEPAKLERSQAALQGRGEGRQARRRDVGLTAPAMDVALALAAALLFALGTVLQQKAGLDEPDATEGSSSGLLLRMARKPVWLAGIAADALGFVGQAVALTIGRLAVVQPLLATSMVFALPLGHRLTAQRVTRADVGAAVLVTALADRVPDDRQPERRPRRRPARRVARARRRSSPGSASR